MLLGEDCKVEKMNSDAIEFPETRFFRNGFDDDRLHEECGVFGIFNHKDASALAVLGLHALQHRGQEAAGIVSFDGEQFYSERRLGLVSEHFTKQPVIDRLRGDGAIGHVRYSTQGETVLRNVQPLFAELASGGFALGHNGEHGCLAPAIYPFAVPCHPS